MTRPFLAAFLVVGIFATQGVTPARAAGPYDPEVEYKTVTTPHFYVSYPLGFGEIALRTAQIAEEAWPTFVERYRWEPRGRITILLNDQSDLANGSATVVPNKVITLFVVAPTRISGLEEYDDWLAAVLIHEMAHIFHLDMAYGMQRGSGRLMLWQICGASTTTIRRGSTEGLAVYEETVSSGAGRGRSTFVDMVLARRRPRRSLSFAHRPGLSSVSRGGRSATSRTSSAGDSNCGSAEKYGEDALLDYHRYYASNPVPFITYSAGQVTPSANEHGVAVVGLRRRRGLRKPNGLRSSVADLDVRR